MIIKKNQINKYIYQNNNKLCVKYEFGIKENNKNSPMKKKTANLFAFEWVTCVDHSYIQQQM